MHKYRLQRRQIGPIYTALSIADLEESIDSAIIENLTHMRQTAGTIVDLDTWCHMFTLGNHDLLSSYLVTISNGQINVS